jgi:hypothetical protein
MRSNRVRPLTVAAALCALLVAACGEGEEETPAACLRGPGPYLEALTRAPAEVRLADSTPISSCLVEDQETGELARVGIALVRAATELNARAGEAPEGPAPIQLGYLVGSVRRGAEETSGIHADLVRRVEATATPDATAAPPYMRGIAAGEEGG